MAAEAENLSASSRVERQLRLIPGQSKFNNVANAKTREHCELQNSAPFDWPV